MMNTQAILQRDRFALLAYITVIVAVLVFVSRESLILMEQAWRDQEEYGYGYLIPVIVGFFVWQRKNDLLEAPMSFSWAGFAILVMGIFVMFIGIVGSARSVTQYGFVTAIIGVFFQTVGWKAFRPILLPMVLLYLMVPLPTVLYYNLSAELQLVSSRLGVWVIRLFDISVYLEGNVIDLGVYKLQVVEACSGLRYLFPLFSLSVIAAYLYQAQMWKRLVIVFSSIPITILMNSFRIGFIGVLVEYWGIEQAEGFLHDFEGWIIFMACTGLLILEMWGLARLGKEKQALSEVFSIELPEPLSEKHLKNLPKFTKLYLVAGVFAVVSALMVNAVNNREEIVPDRKTFAEFPLRIADWVGKQDRLESIYLDVLKLDDYLLTDYRNEESASINLHVAYYGSQHADIAAHSPRVCLPGGGWKIVNFSEKELDLENTMANPLRVNRVLIKKDDYTQLVYYWFPQRGRIVTNEYLVKWYLFWDGLTRRRTDGALVRLTAFVGPEQDIDDVEEQLKAFTAEVVPVLDQFIPN